MKRVRPLVKVLEYFSARELLVLSTLTAGRIILSLLDLIAILLIGSLGGFLASGTLPWIPSELAVRLQAMDSSEIALLLAISASGLFLAKSALSALALWWTARFLGRNESRRVCDVFAGLLSPNELISRGQSLSEMQFSLGFSAYVAFSRLPFAVINLVVDSFLAIAVLTLFFIASPSLAAIATGVLISAILVFQALVNRPLRRVGSDISGSAIGIGQQLFEGLNLRDEIWLTGRVPWFVSRFVEIRTRYSNGHALERFLTGLPRFFMETLIALGIAGASIAFLLGDSEGETTQILGIFIAGSLRLAGAVVPIQQSIADIRTDLPQAGPALHQFRRHNKSTPTAPSNPELGISTMGNAPPEVVLDHVFFTYEGSLAPALSNVTVTIPARGVTVVVGPSGGGKSTLARLIGGMLVPERGQILIDGIPANQWAQTFPGKIAYVPQKPAVFSGSLAENVALGPLEDSHELERIYEIFAALELDQLSKRQESGLEAPLNPKLSNLSVGQLQRIGLARVLFAAPSIVILDEPTSALDKTSSRIVYNLIAQIRKNATVILVSHDTFSNQVADLTLEVTDSRLVYGPGDQHS